MCIRDSSGAEKPSHKHTWTAQKTTVQHPATGHNEQVLVKDENGSFYFVKCEENELPIGTLARCV